MRFMAIMRATPESESGAMPKDEVLTAMGEFNEELVKAGVMLAGEGLHPSASGVRLHFSAGRPRLIDGPFAQTRELIAGFWLWQVRSKEEAIEWARRIPNPDGSEFEVELRQVFEAEDFGEEFTPEARTQEARLRAEVDARSH